MIEFIAVVACIGIGFAVGALWPSRKPPEPKTRPVHPGWKHFHTERRKRFERTIDYKKRVSRRKRQNQ